MELFSVVRYTDNKIPKPETNENAILDSLLTKIEKQKQKRKLKESDAVAAKKVLIVEETAEGKADVSGQNAAGELIGVDDPITETQSDENVDEAATSGFQVLGEDVALTKPQKVNMVLPEWLAHPTIISRSLTIATEDADAGAASDSSVKNVTYLAPHIRSALKELRIKRLFPVQTAVIPWILEAHAKPTPFRPRDICVSAPTGSGKTLAFAAPIVQLLATRVERKIRALVVLPVSELALQVFKVFVKLCEKTNLNVSLLSTKFSLAQEQEKLVELYKGNYYSKVDILVTTPGRLVEHLHATKGFCLKSLKFLVIDEADRIMDAVFQNWLYHLDEHVRATSDQLLSGRAAPLCYNELMLSARTQPHKLLFSATLSQDPEKLQNLRLFQPKLFTSVTDTNSLENMSDPNAVDNTQASELTKSEARGEFVGKYTTPAELTEKYCLTESRFKPLTLYSLIKENNWKRFLCFTNSIESSNRLTFVLQDLFKQSGICIEELSASLTPKERSRALSQFVRGKINGLVCSDALARGIDVPDVDIVVSYDPARHIKTYIHRVGRTARAGRPGTAITLVCPKELIALNKTLLEAGKTITDEITTSTTTEEDVARKYTYALKNLRRKVEIDKKQVLVQKRHAHTKSQLHKNSEQLSLVDKLKLQTIELKETIEQKLKPKVKVPKRLMSKKSKAIRKTLEQKVE